ncbi:alpha/beta hydrolase [Longimicrobium sp.]|uniref:alpha/beta fold hydrolase n=1 Tax=Longimicrobium sp. TaxID=2029185 RepID=UPI002E32828E|nr:alpha/beta hydrolase [Longimicrobium sp.]HEX6041150.1 alpha/beta hydrolase [Longimicrobium sp.]
MGNEAGWTHHEAVVNNVRLHWVEAGEGPPVLLLHGFPEFWYEWRHQLAALAGMGYRAVAPDLRGYNLSEKPEGVEAYRIEKLVDDVRGLIRHLGVERAHVVGHDWGGVVAWWLAMIAPEQIDRLVIINAPHPQAFRRELMTPDQMLRSWYAAAFQVPLLPEAAFRANDFALLGRIFRASSVRPGAFSDEDIRRYREAAARPGAITAMINYYRAAARYPGPPARAITTPTLLIWGEQDQALSIRLTEGLDEWVPGIRIERVPGVSHWVPAEAPDRVNELLAGFLSPR